MNEKTIDEIAREYYKQPYTTKGINVIDLFKLPMQYPNDKELGRAFRELIAAAQEIEYVNKNK
jgi:hypothetical protein